MPTDDDEVRAEVEATEDRLLHLADDLDLVVAGVRRLHAERDSLRTVVAAVRRWRAAHPGHESAEAIEEVDAVLATLDAGGVEAERLRHIAHTTSWPCQQDRHDGCQQRCMTCLAACRCSCHRALDGDVAGDLGQHEFGHPDIRHTSEADR